MSDRTEFLIDIVARSASAESAAKAMEELTDRLTGANSAAVAAAEAAKNSEAKYKSQELAVNKAAKALERLELKASSAQQALNKSLLAGDREGVQKAAGVLNSLNQKRDEAGSKLKSMRASLADQAKALDVSNVAAKKAKEAHEALAKKIEEAQKKAAAEKKSKQEAYQRNELLASSLQRLGGPLGFVGAKVFQVKGAWDKLGKALGSAAPYASAAVGFTAIAAAIALAGAAAAGLFAVAVVKTLSWAVALGDAARSSRNLAAGFIQSQGAAAFLSSRIEEIQNSVPLADGEVAKLAKSLAQSGLRGQALSDELQKASEAAAEAKFGPEWSREMNSLDQMSKRLTRNIQGMFSGPKVQGALDKFLSQISTLVDLFDKSTIAGDAIYSVIEEVFGAAIDGAAGMIPAIERAFLQFEILALKALIAIKPHWSQIMLIGKAFLAVGAVVSGVFAVAIGGLVVVLGALSTGIVGTTLLIGGWFLAFKSAIDWIRRVNLLEVGTQIIQGLVNGITRGTDLVVKAVKGVASSAVNAAKSALSIQSPSKVFEQLGAYTGEGFSIGVDRSAPEAQASIRDLVSVPSVRPQTSAASGTSSSVNLSGATFNFYGVEGAEAVESRLSEVLTKLIEGDAAQLGAKVAA